MQWRCVVRCHSPEIQELGSTPFLAFTRIWLFRFHFVDITSLRIDAEMEWGNTKQWSRNSWTYFDYNDWSLQTVFLTPVCTILAMMLIQKSLLTQARNCNRNYSFENAIYQVQKLGCWGKLTDRKKLLTQNSLFKLHLGEIGSRSNCNPQLHLSFFCALQQ